MDKGFLTENVKLVKVSDAAIAGTSAVNGASVDLGGDGGGWDGVVFLSSIGTAAANNLMKVQGSDDNSSFADLASSEVDTGATDKNQYVDIQRPQHRYLRPVLTRGTSTTVEAVWALLYRGTSRPVSQDVAGTLYGKRLVSPAAGTA